MVPATTRAICATEEYAIKALRSVCRRQTSPVSTAPVREILRRRGVEEYISC